MKQLISILSIVLFVSTGCSKKEPITDINSDYIGLWAASDGSNCTKYINIESTGNARYYEGGASGDCSEKTIGQGIAKTDGQCMFIGSSKLPILAAPLYDVSVKTWHLKLEIDNQTVQFDRIQ
ncbi:MAG: hypothetical protein MK212_20680 [Saprospiraceae bacterium]|nr:hypothetical protein [Saprospiraceae bacterium]